MTYNINKAQFDAVIRLSGPDRYKHFISRIADWQQVWTLKQPDGFVTMGDDEGHVCIPLWPHPDYATALGTGEWATCKPEEIDLAPFRNKWIPGMIRDNYFAAIFPTPQEKGVVVSAKRLQEDLAEELARIE
jgi:hypothetical protein